MSCHGDVRQRAALDLDEIMMRATRVRLLAEIRGFDSMTRLELADASRNLEALVDEVRRLQQARDLARRLAERAEVVDPFSPLVAEAREKGVL